VVVVIRLRKLVRVAIADETLAVLTFPEGVAIGTTPLPMFVGRGAALRALELEDELHVHQR
jgi:hypothetical protein